MTHETRLLNWIAQDSDRMRALRLVAQLSLPQAWVAAGFVRNLVWDELHNKPGATPLNDIDVVYFDSSESHSDTEQICENWLAEKMPEFNWQVRNQARMSQRNQDPVYRDVFDAMSYWPEKETAIAVRLNSCQQLECKAVFGLTSLFALKLSHNPKRNKNVFLERVSKKNWLTHWPRLTLGD